MNLPCLIGMILCSPMPETPEKAVRANDHAEGIPLASQLIGELGRRDVKEREAMVLDWFRRGYWPKSQSRFRAIHAYADGHHLIYWVMADYLRLGSDEDSVLMPLAWTSVRDLAKDWQLLLPTSKMVDQIYQQSERTLWPHAYPPTEEMRSTEYLVNHNQWIKERQGWDLYENPIIAGHKKDLVVSKRLLKAEGKLAIYGWHNIGNGTAIQPQSLWHGQFYVDYSHGIRFVSPEAELDGERVLLAEILSDPRLASMISFEGPFDVCAVLRYDCEPLPVP